MSTNNIFLYKIQFFKIKLKNGTILKINRNVLFHFKIPLVGPVKPGFQFWNFSYFLDLDP